MSNNVRNGSCYNARYTIVEDLNGAGGAHPAEKKKKCKYLFLIQCTFL